MLESVPVSGQRQENLGKMASPYQTKQKIWIQTAEMTYPAVCGGYGKEGRLTPGGCGLSNRAFPV